MAEMTPQKALEILEVNAICSPKATKFKEAVEVAKQALEKQIPKKVESYDIGYECLCPCCGFDLMGSINEPDHDPPYCFECGQALDWSDTE